MSCRTQSAPFDPDFGDVDVMSSPTANPAEIGFGVDLDHLAFSIAADGERRSARLTADQALAFAIALLFAANRAGAREPAALAMLKRGQRAEWATAVRIGRSIAAADADLERVVSAHPMARA